MRRQQQQQQQQQQKHVQLHHHRAGFSPHYKHSPPATASTGCQTDKSEFTTNE